jgi:hypothetical protein
VKNVRITAAPNNSLFDGGVRYLQNSVVVENQTQPYKTYWRIFFIGSCCPGYSRGGSMGVEGDIINIASGV